MTIAQTKELILLKQRHRSLVHACERLLLALENGSSINRNAAIAEISDLLKKWELIEA
jgi:hypothetical protein